MSDIRTDSEKDSDLDPELSESEFLFPRINMRNKKNRKRTRPLADSPVSPNKGRGSKEPRNNGSGVKTPSPVASPQPTEIVLAAPSHSSWFTPNPFSTLTPREEPVTKIMSGENEDNSHKPPPIFIKNVIDFSGFIKTFSEKFGKNSFLCKSMSQKIMINFFKKEHYREAVHFLRTLNATFHTYEIKDEKAYRIVVRHLHPTTSKETIKAELEAKGFSVRRVTNVLKQSTKEPLPLFFIDLEPSKTNNEIFKINTLVYCRVKVEEPYKKREIVQCKRCQEYRPTRMYCNYIPKCVKCADSHLSEECMKPKDFPKKCALCGGNHTANYRGCDVHKTLQKKTNGPISRHPTSQPMRHQEAPPQPTQNHYPQLPLQPHLLPQAQEAPKASSYAAVTRSHAAPPPPTFNAPPLQSSCVPPPPSSNDLTSFLTEFKNMISPLISLLTTVMSTLLPALAQLNPALTNK